AAFLRLAKLWHPDKQRDPDKTAESTRRFQKLQVAYERLVGKGEKDVVISTPAGWAAACRPRPPRKRRFVPEQLQELSSTQLRVLLASEGVFLLHARTKAELRIAVVGLLLPRELRRLLKALGCSGEGSVEELRQRAGSTLNSLEDADDELPGCGPAPPPGAKQCQHGCGRLAPSGCSNVRCRLCCLGDLAGLECSLHEDNDDFLLTDSDDESTTGGAEADTSESDDSPTSKTQGCASKCGAAAAVDCENYRCAACCASLGAGRRRCDMHGVAAFVSC
ncbi:unnamed protein product, partial [Symbiodinium sp. CCMP2456]